MLFLQSPEALSGGAGWVGAGLLGLVLAWLFFFHLPAKDAQLKGVLDAKDAQLSVLMDRFKAAMDVVVAHCKDDSAKLVEAFRSELKLLLDRSDAKEDRREDRR